MMLSQLADLCQACMYVLLLYLCPAVQACGAEAVERHSRRSSGGQRRELQLDRLGRRHVGAASITRVVVA
jgi:hypothetical protein